MINNNSTSKYSPREYLITDTSKDTPFKINASLALNNNFPFPFNQYLDIASRHAKSNSKLRKQYLYNPNKLTSKRYESFFNKNNDNNSDKHSEFSKFLLHKPKNKRILFSGMSQALTTNNTENNVINIFSDKNIDKLKSIVTKSPLSTERKSFLTKNAVSENNLNYSEKNRNTNYNLPRIVQNIKKSCCKNALSENISYDKKLENVVLDANRVLNIHRRINNNVFKKYDGMVDYINNNKEISVKNIMLDVINKRNSNLLKDYIEREKHIENYGEEITNNEGDFSEFSHLQRKSSLQIIDALSKIHQKNRFLLIQEYKHLSSKKLLEDYILKSVEQIDSLRIYAKFVHKILFDDCSIFQKEILPEDDVDKYKIIDDITSKNFKIYENFLTINLNKDKEYSFLQEPEMMFQKYKEIENKLIREIEKAEKILEDVVVAREENEEILKELKERIKKIQHEYDLNYEKYDNYRKNIYNGEDNMKEVTSSQNYMNAAYELCDVMCEIFGNEVNFEKHLTNRDFQDSKITDKLEICRKILAKREKIVGDYLLKLGKFEKESPKVFQVIVNRRIIENKKKSKQEKLGNMEESGNQKYIEVEEKTNKLLFLSRQSAFPPQLTKKTGTKKVINKKDNSQGVYEDLYY